MTCPRAAMAAIDAAIEEWLDRGECRIRALSPQIVLALVAAGYEIRPIGARPDPASVDALLEGLRHAGYELQPRKETAA